MGLKLSAVTLLVPTYEAGLSFFVGVLEFDLEEDLQLSATKRWVRVAPKSGGCSFILAEPTTDEQRMALGHQTGGRVGFFLYADDFQNEHNRLVAAGLQFQEEVRSEAYGQVCVFKDPFGNSWDLLGPPR